MEFRAKPKRLCFSAWVDSEGFIHGFELSGHAGFADPGQDVVCAGVSALSIAAVNGLEHFLSVPPQVREGTGFLACSLGPLGGEEFSRAQWILETLRLGLEGIRAAYGDEYLMIEQRRWTPC
ncbi:Cysteine peptidase C108, N-terminal of ribosomal L27 [Acididesulfobacillus acetoxydans]|uniref:Ribosomal processing cysteine protease Prp n=1 Tax=Acididesulfobacillus acetoxydans TaxID=1561005 RepID=A0A8S0VVG1_9FIRM|nr:ribosomal-processing cysteine protease Prp [Acididesulfobacillus acetoxydans]CAA7599423.1 Cysteine peptidase C108, N-terminal of ribosomal L27 [Acididesulfobacillus acetoxydans]CEJ06771.1 Protein of unknown function (DUF464) [Acididesulfobacillus acetoxydans]